MTVIRQLRMHCGLGMKVNTPEMPHCMQRSLTHFVSTCVVGKNPNTPNWSSMADDTITWGSIGVLGSLFYICGMNIAH